MKKNLIFFLFIFLNLLSINIFCQAKIDSLQLVLKKLSNKTGYTADTTRYNTLMSIIYALSDTEIDSVPNYLAKGKSIAKKLNNELMIAEVIRTTGWYNYLISDYETALSNTSNALTISQKYITSDNELVRIKALKLKANTLSDIGVIRSAQGRYPIALESYFLALKINEMLGRKSAVERALNGIGIVYLYQKENLKALMFLLKAMQINEQLGNKIGKARNMVVVGNVHLQSKNNSLALKYYLDALKIIEGTNSFALQSNINSNIGRIFSDQGNCRIALDYYFKAVNIYKTTNNKSGLVITLGNISATYCQLKRYNLAEEYAKKELQLALELESLEDIKQAHEDFCHIYQETNRPALALDHYKRFIIYRDSITNVENDKAIIQKELQYNYDKKATADSIVNTKAQEIKDAQLAKNKLEIKAKQNQQYALFGGLALVLVFAGFIYSRFKITQRQKVIIEEQKKLVDISQKKTMDSINYAKKIQHSILPSSEQLGAFFPNHFIFFKPKDIVSGDFYWFHHQDNLSFIAVADCTGHGCTRSLYDP